MNMRSWYVVPLPLPKLKSRVTSVRHPEPTLRTVETRGQRNQHSPVNKTPSLKLDRSTTKSGGGSSVSKVLIVNTIDKD